MRAKEQVIHRLCEIMGEVMDGNFICFCGENKMSDLEAIIKPEDVEALNRVEEILMMFKDDIKYGMNI